MTVAQLIEKLKKMPQDAIVGREVQDELSVYFDNYEHVVKSDKADGNLVFIF